MLSTLIDKYKDLKKKRLLAQITGHTKQYAFVGVGNHSISNLYPIIDFLGVPLKYICTKTPENARLMAKKYRCEGTHDYQKVLTDPTIDGIFISTAPSVHFTLVKQALKAGKNIFVEKPPCLSKSELEELIELQGKSKVVVGLQKRYSKVYQTIKSTAKNASSYNYKYLTGAYPEGDAIWDLFIHPLDIAIYLFGKITHINCLSNKETSFIQLTHTNNIIGTIELSTAYTWDSAKEEIIVNTPKGTFESTSCFDLTFTPKSSVLLGVPVEKVMKNTPSKQLLIHNNRFVPTMDFNSLNIQGYADEINTFVSLNEGKNANNLSDLKDLLETYKLIELVKSSL